MFKRVSILRDVGCLLFLSIFWWMELYWWSGIAPNPFRRWKHGFLPSLHCGFTAPDAGSYKGVVASVQARKLVKLSRSPIVFSRRKDFVRCIDLNIAILEKMIARWPHFASFSLCRESQTPLSRSAHRRIKPKRNKGRRACFHQYGSTSGDA